MIWNHDLPLAAQTGNSPNKRSDVTAKRDNDSILLQTRNLKSSIVESGCFHTIEEDSFSLNDLHINVRSSRSTIVKSQGDQIAAKSSVRVTVATDAERGEVECDVVHLSCLLQATTVFSVDMVEVSAQVKMDVDKEQFMKDLSQMNEFLGYGPAETEAECVAHIEELLERSDLIARFKMTEEDLPFMTYLANWYLLEARELHPEIQDLSDGARAYDRICNIFRQLKAQDHKKIKAAIMAEFAYLKATHRCRYGSLK